MTRSPRSACLLQWWNQRLRAPIIKITRTLQLDAVSQRAINSTAVREREKKKKKKDLRNGRIDARPVARRILRPEHQAARDAADAAEADEGRARKGTRPLPTDVVRLVRHARRDVGVGTRGAEEHACVSGRVALGEAHHGKADDAEQGVED